MTIDQHKHIEQIKSVLEKTVLPLTTEKELQHAIELLFEEEGIKTDREFRLNNRSIPDFFIDGIVIEVKIKGSAKAIYKQCERYMQFEQAKALLLITNKTFGMPPLLCGKPTYVHSLGKNWL